MMAKYSPFAVQIRDANDDGVRGKFSLNVKHETLDEKMFSWEIERTVEQFQNLRMDLLRENKNLDINQFVADDVSSDLSQLQTTFTSLLNDVGDQAWHHKSLLKFLEDSSSPSVIMNLKVDHLSDQVLQLTNDLRLQTERVESLQTSHNCLFNIVQDILSGNDSSVKRRLSSGRSSQELLRSMYQQQAFASASNTSTNFTDGEIDDCSNRSSFMSVGMPDLPHNSSSKGPDTLSTANGLTSFSHSSDLGDHDVVTLKLDSESKSPLPLRERAMEELLKESPDKSEKAEPSKAALALAPVLSRQITDDVTSSNGSIPSTPHFPAHLHPSEAMSAYYSAAVDQILRAVRPNNAQMQYRASVISMLKKQVRLCLNSNAMPTGLHDILCSLPDDPINVSVVLSKNLLTNWHICLVDRLNLVNERLATTGNFDMVFAEEEEQLMYLPDDYSSPMRHEVTHMTHNKLNMNFSIQLNVDNSCEVEVLANNRHDLCMLAFVEEFASLVGKEDLFKRSLLLIRAWWHYETAAYVGTPIKHYLKDSNICVMVCAIFNQFHTRISSPLQALCLFLAEYSAYDGATQAITLQGIVPFHGADGTQLHHIEPNKKHLLSPALIEKYQQLFNLADVVKAKSPQNGVHFAQPHAPVPVPEVPQAAPVVFVREAFNVLHPFMPANILAQTDETRLGPLSQLSRAFVEGGKNLSLALSKTYNAPSVAQAGEMVGAFENILRHRLGELQQEELVNALLAAESTSKTPPYGDPEVAVSVDKHWQNIMYCNFIIKSVVSESAILTFCIDVLSMIGLMTADDLGKRLNEASKVPQLMVALKDQVGGLKEFLKRFPDVFVFSFEHPYNPHIFLRIVLSPDLQAEVENGVLPVKFLSQIIAKFGRIAPPPPKVDSPSMRRKMLVPTAPAAASHANNTLDEKVLFGHERSAGGANTLRLMQSDIDLVNVVGAEPPQPPTHHQQQQQHNPYAPPFVPAQTLAPSRKVTNTNGHLQQQAPALSLSLHGGSSLSGQPASYFQQDLNLSSGMGLGNTSLNKGNVSSNSSLAGSTGPSRLLYDLDYQDALLDGTDYFGDTLSLNGDARGTTSDLLSSLREDTLQVDDFSSPGLGLGSGLAAGLGGGAANSRANGAYGSANSNGRGRFSAPQSLDGFSGEFDFEAAAASSLDPYHQASTTSTSSAAAVGGLGAKSRYGGSHLLGGAGVDDFNPSADAAYIPNTYGGYHGAADYQAQHAAHGHHPPPPPHHHHQQHAPQYGHGQQQAPTAYGPGARGMTRTNSRPLMLNPQGQVIGQQPPPQQQQQHKFQHKRYDASQQFKK